MDKKTIECSVCSGKGFIPCKTCGGNTTVKCPDCGGEGREYKIICQTCHKGYVTDTRSLDDDKTLCPDCHGNYREDLGPCKKCDGKGVLSCETCNGTGKTECMVCKGKGKISCWDYIEVVYPKDVDEFVSIHGDKGKYTYRSLYERALGMLKVHDVTPKVWNEFHNYVVDKNNKQNKRDEAFFLAVCLAKGIYHGSNKDKDFGKGGAQGTFKRLAELGYPYGQFIYGCMCLNEFELELERRGGSSSGLESEGIKWLEKAGESNVALALVELAVKNMGCLNPDNYQEKMPVIWECCRKIMAIKDHGGECDDVLYEFAKAHDDFFTRANNGESVRDDMQKWWRGHGGPFYAMTKKELANECKRRNKEAKGMEKAFFKSEKRRWKFVLVGVLFGLFGLQFAYVRRWKFFFAHWAALIATLFFPLAFIVCLVLWLGSVFFMKHDGAGLWLS